MITNQRVHVVTFLILLVLSGILVFFMWLPFFKLTAVAFILAILFNPVYKKILKHINSEIASAWATILLILSIVFFPLYLLGQMLFSELVGLYNQFRTGGFVLSQNEVVAHLPLRLQTVANSLLKDIGSQLSHLTINFASVTNVVSWGAGLFFSVFLVFFATFFLLKDGDRLREYLNSVFPLSRSKEDALTTRLESAINGVVKGQFLVALTQGVVGVIGFLIFGVPQPVLWGAFTVLAALVPTVGTSIAMIPAVIYLFATNHIGAGIGMAIWAALAVGLIDNLTAPKLISSRTKLHPLLVLLGVVGGITFFGYLGFLLGPIFMAVFVAMLDMYRTDLKEYLEK